MNYEELVKALRDIEKTMFALGTSSIKMDNVSIRLAYDKKWGRTAKEAADAIEALNRLVDLNTERCEGLREQLRKAQEQYEKHLNELEQQLPKRGEIVRCGECKWYGIYYAKKDGTPDKRYRPSVCLRGKYAKRRDPDWFCADGEREVQE